MGTNFLDYPHKPSFAAFSDTMIYWWEASYTSNVMKYTVGQESGRIEATILWEMYGHQYPRLHGMGFTGFFHAMEYWWQISFISPMIKYAFFFSVKLEDKPGETVLLRLILRLNNRSIRMVFYDLF